MRLLVRDGLMSIEFSETAPGIHMASWKDVRSGELRNVAVIEALERWSVYVDGELIAENIATRAQAIRRAEAAVRKGSRGSFKLVAGLTAAAVVAGLVVMGGPGSAYQGISSSLKLGLAWVSDQAAPPEPEGNGRTVEAVSTVLKPQVSGESTLAVAPVTTLPPPPVAKVEKPTQAGPSRDVIRSTDDVGASQTKPFAAAANRVAENKAAQKSRRFSSENNVLNSGTNTTTPPAVRNFSRWPDGAQNEPAKRDAGVVADPFAPDAPPLPQRSQAPSETAATNGQPDTNRDGAAGERRTKSLPRETAATSTPPNAGAAVPDGSVSDARGVTAPLVPFSRHASAGAPRIVNGDESGSRAPVTAATAVEAAPARLVRKKVPKVRNSQKKKLSRVKPGERRRVHRRHVARRARERRRAARIRRRILREDYRARRRYYRRDRRRMSCFAGRCRWIYY